MVHVILGIYCCCGDWHGYWGYDLAFDPWQFCGQLNKSRYYTIYDLANKRIGLTLAKQPSSAQAPGSGWGHKNHPIKQYGCVCVCVCFVEGTLYTNGSHNVWVVLRGTLYQKMVYDRFLGVPYFLTTHQSFRRLPHGDMESDCLGGPVTPMLTPMTFPPNWGMASRHQLLTSVCV